MKDYNENQIKKLKLARKIAKFIKFNNVEYIAYAIISQDENAAIALYRELDFQLGMFNEEQKGDSLL